MSLLRLVTIHPALVHFTIGAMPLLVLAYAVARARRSAKWGFVGDVTLWVTAAISVVTGAFGLVSYWKLGWPGGLELWQRLHLGIGVALVISLGAFALARARRPRSAPDGVTLAVALGIASLAMVEGWIGGEVLVFRSGMAVQAAGGGALALDVPGAPRGDPKTTLAAMRSIRPAWGAVTTSVAAMVVSKPTPEGFANVAGGASRIEHLAAWLGQNGAASLDLDDEQPGAMAMGGGPRADDHEHEGEAEETPKQQLQRWSEELGSSAKALREGAERRDVEAVTKAAGRMQSTCVGCHDDLRWQHHHHHDD